MNIVIVGMGEVGRELAFSLNDRQTNVTIIDCSAARLEWLREQLDVMTVVGDGATVAVLKDANIAAADLFIAVTGADADNILACHTARHFGVPKTICRLSAAGYFSDADGLPPSALGIDHCIFPEADCVSRIVSTLEHQSIVERLPLGFPDVEITALRVGAESPLNGLALHAFPDQEILTRIRFSAILRNQALLVPRCDTRFLVGDEVYVAGRRADIQAIYDSFHPNGAMSGSVVVSGTNRLARRIVKALLAQNVTVRVIEKDEHVGERFLDEIGGKTMLLRGDVTESDVLDEARVPDCAAFISVLEDDEDNTLSSILAKKKGAGKVITVTNKPEYVDIVPAMTTIDCAFSPRLVAVNSVLSTLGTTAARVQAVLQRTRAYVYEFTVDPHAPIRGCRLDECHLSPKAVIALLVRGADTIPATGDVVLQAGDNVLVVAAPEGGRRIEKLFARSGIFGLRGS